MVELRRGTFYSFHGEIKSKNIARTAKRQGAGQQRLLFGVYLQTLLSLKLPDKDALSSELANYAAVNCNPDPPNLGE